MRSAARRGTTLVRWPARSRNAAAAGQEPTRHRDRATSARRQKSIVKHRVRILAAIEHNLPNGLIESVNTKIRLITRIAFGFKSAEALIALALLNLGGHRPTLPGRN